MTRVYDSPHKTTGLRVVAAGAGFYPHAKVPADDGVPALKDLTSVVPSIMTFLRRLLTEWRPNLALDLVSVDLLLSDPKQPGGATWPSFGVPGECLPNRTVDPPTMATLDGAFRAALAGSSSEDGLLVLFCGHGFFRTDRYFVLSDFGQAADPWSSVVNLTGMELGLRQTPPRTQWLFWDCCADIPTEILDTLGTVGSPVIQPRASKIASATASYGPLSRFGVASSPTGEQAFGIPDQPSRFTEMLIESLDSAGATKREGEFWWVNDRGMMDAMQTYAQRHPDLTDPQFYLFVMPFSSDAPQRICFRKIPEAPKSLLIASSNPRTALKAANVRVDLDGSEQTEPLFSQVPPGRRAILYVPLPARQYYKVTAEFGGGAGPSLVKTCFADLPLAELVEFTVP